MESAVEAPTEVVDNTTEKTPKGRKKGQVGEDLKRISSGTNSYVYMDKTKEALEVALGTGKNLILFGAGGYGKSEFTQAFLRENGIEPFIVQMGSGITVDRVFGGVDLKEFENSGDLKYFPERSFMNYEYVIFEELFDSPDYVLEQLKDILSSGKFRNGTEVFDIKTKLIICCTNRTREEFAKNASLRALCERFPLEHEVKWTQHNRSTYEKLLNTVFGHADPLLTFVCEYFEKNKKRISPRICLAAAQVIHKMGPEKLCYVADFGQSPDLLREATAQFKAIFEFEETKVVVNEIMADLNDFDKKIKDTPKGARIPKDLLLEYGETIKLLGEKIETLKNLKVSDKLVASHVELVKICNDSYDVHLKSCTQISGIEALDSDNEEDSVQEMNSSSN
jgi:hypothetical protein